MELFEEDEAEISRLWRQFDAEATQAMDKIAWTYLEKLDKLTFNTLGYRDRDPENHFERYQEFCEFVRRVYLRPSMENVTNASSIRDGVVPVQGEFSDEDDFE